MAELPPVRMALRGGQGTIEYHDRSDGQTWLAAYLPTKKTAWPVVVAYPTTMAYPLVQSTLLRGLLSLLAVTLFAVLISVISARTITISLDRLTKAARAIAGGDLRQRVEMKTGDELQQLADAFNTMSESLSTSVDDLARAKKEEIAQKSAQLQRLLVRTVRTQKGDGIHSNSACPAAGFDDPAGAGDSYHNP